MDSFHKLLKKQVSFTKDVEVVDVDNDKGDKANVNYISGIGFQSQRFGNQSGNRKFIGTVQRSNYNQDSQYQKLFSKNNMNHGPSSYQNPAPTPMCRNHS